MLHGPLDAFADALCATIASSIQAFDAHQRGIGSHTRLSACRSVTQHGSRTVRTVTVVVHWVVVVVLHIVAMVRKLGTAVPKMVGHIHVVVVDTRIDDSHHNAFTCVSQVPHLIGANLNDILRDLTRNTDRP